MNKIYTLTFGRCLSYGAVLQTYALKTKLEELSGRSVEVLDYENECVAANNYKIAIKFSGIKAFVYSIARLPHTIVKKRNFDKFLNTYIFRKGQAKFTRDTISQVADEGLIVVGSDQVWNCEITGGDPIFFLDFVSKTKCKASYAASFGTKQIFDTNKEEYLRLLRNFGEISLREEIGAEEISQELKKPCIHIDPTLLLDGAHWFQLAKDTKLVTRPKEKYILVYNVLVPNVLYDAAIQLSKQTGYKIIQLQGPILNKKAKILLSISPQSFLSLIANAEYIFTTSFHGVAFSVLFIKKFFTELNCKLSDGSHAFNYRVERLLKLLGLKNRDVKDLNVDYAQGIDWEAVEEKLNNERRSSFDYLQNLTKE